MSSEGSGVHVIESQQLINVKKKVNNLLQNPLISIQICNILLLFFYYKNYYIFYRTIVN